MGIGSITTILGTAGDYLWNSFNKCDLFAGWLLSANEMLRMVHECYRHPVDFADSVHKVDDVPDMRRP